MWVEKKSRIFLTDFKHCIQSKNYWLMIKASSNLSRSRRWGWKKLLGRFVLKSIKMRTPRISPSLRFPLPSLSASSLVLPSNQLPPYDIGHLHRGDNSELWGGVSRLWDELQATAFCSHFFSIEGCKVPTWDYGKQHSSRYHLTLLLHVFKLTISQRRAFLLSSWTFLVWLHDLALEIHTSTERKLAKQFEWGRNPIETMCEERGDLHVDWRV